jgi:D-glycero-alpha-D-manno-heptose-7-phosphate kinase
MPVHPRVVNAVAPIRVCDNGGWTDTWFAGTGAVCNIAVHPCVEVQVLVHDRATGGEHCILNAENYGDRYAVAPGAPLPDRHPLLEATIDEMGVPDDVAVEITIFCEAPAGCSTGTSAAVTVALVGALDALTPGRLSPHEIAATAHRIESDRLGLQSGVQDQLCSAFGGISYIEIAEYPRASVSTLRIPDGVWWELERRLVLVFLGRTHVSSAVHDKVIADVTGSAVDRLAPLRLEARAMRDALLEGDLDALGASMSRNTDAQAALHEDLVNPTARALIELGREHGAVGWKVNGAGGEGGSLTLLCGPSSSAKRALLASLADVDPLCQHIPTHLSRTGLRVW